MTSRGPVREVRRCRSSLTCPVGEERRRGTSRTGSGQDTADTLLRPDCQAMAWESKPKPSMYPAGMNARWLVVVAALGLGCSSGATVPHGEAGVDAGTKNDAAAEAGPGGDAAPDATLDARADAADASR